VATARAVAERLPSTRIARRFASRNRSWSWSWEPIPAPPPNSPLLNCCAF